MQQIQYAQMQPASQYGGPPLPSSPYGGPPPPSSPYGGQPQPMMPGYPQQQMYATPPTAVVVTANAGVYPPGTTICCGRPLFHILGLLFGFSVLSNVCYAMGGYVILVAVLGLVSYCPLFGSCVVLGFGSSASFGTATLSDFLSSSGCSDTSGGMRACTVLALLTALGCFGCQVGRLFMDQKMHPLLSKVAMGSAVGTAAFCIIAGAMEVAAAGCFSSKISGSGALSIAISVSSPTGVDLLVMAFFSLLVAGFCYKSMLIDTAVASGATFGGDVVGVYQPMLSPPPGAMMMQQQSPYNGQQQFAPQQQQQQMYAPPPPSHEHLKSVDL